MTELKSNFISHQHPNLWVDITEDPKTYPGGGHTYKVRECVGWDNENQCTAFVDSYQEIHFVRKNQAGELSAGITSEQLLQLLIHRHEQLNKAFPSPQNEEFNACLQRALDLLEERVKDRISRNVMGELKK